MARYAKPTNDELRARLSNLKAALQLIEPEMALARENNDLHAYEYMKMQHDAFVQDIEATISKLYPMMPRSWFDKYGDFIEPKLPSTESEAS